MSKHTAGSWTVNKQPKRDGRNLWIGGVDVGAGFQQEVADIYTHHPRANANARLIAAAPDLLAAIAYIAKLWEADEPIEESDMRPVYAAIAAATRPTP